MAARTTTAVADAAGVRPVDVVLAVAVALFTVFGTATSATPARLDVVAVTLLAGSGLLLVAHRVWPRAVFLATLALHVSYLVLGYPEGSEWVPTMVALGSATSAYGWRTGVPLAALCLVMSLTDVPVSGLSAVDAETMVIIVALGCAIAVGEWLRTRRAYLVAVEERAAALERSRQDEARRLVDQERLRIAREVHDVVAHAITSINVQASVGEHVSAEAPERAREALAVIRRASGEALADLRALLGMLRVDDSESRTAPRRLGLDAIDGLVSNAERAGLEVEVVVEGAARPLPAAIDAAAYRIVQEALTNAIKHAACEHVTVRIAYRDGAVDLSVEDDGRGGTAAAPGMGITGMRERVTLLGGTFAAGPRPEGGFAVHAWLPLRAS
ncbi:MAG TPA: sensor histidine kinase [Egibacteraceae bacterium]